MSNLCELVRLLNKGWRECGQTSEIVIENENISITGKEIIVKIPVEMTIRIPADRLETESVSPCSNSRSKSE